MCREHEVDGIIATNTTIERTLVSSELSEPGGLSGIPLRAKSTEIIRYLHRKDPMLPIIGVGGVFTAEDAYEKIQAGATLVQVYTGFVFEGPLMVKRVNKGLIALLKRDGFKNIKDAVGSRAH